MQQMRRHILYMSNKYTLGIDIGSTTVKIAILDENDTLLFADYQRHFANIQETLAELLAKAYGKLGELTLHPVITGSGGLTLANHLGVPFVQEVIAVSTSLQKIAPQTDVAIELGGEDAKIIYFEGGNIEQIPVARSPAPLIRIFIYSSFSFGKTRFRNTATRVDSATGDLPKIVVTHAGSCASAAFACVTPIPSAMASPTMDVFL